MLFKIKSITVRVEYSFFVVLSFALLCGYTEILNFLLFSALHELGHIAALLLLGGKISSVNIAFFGASLKYGDNLPLAFDAIVIFAGPLVNLILYFILKDNINIFLFTVNMFPIFPLDGGRLLKLLLPRAYVCICYFLLAALTIFALYSLFAYHSYSLLPVLVYLWLFNIKFS